MESRTMGSIETAAAMNKKNRHVIKRSRDSLYLSTFFSHEYGKTNFGLVQSTPYVTKIEIKLAFNEVDCMYDHTCSELEIEMMLNFKDAVVYLIN